MYQFPTEAAPVSLETIPTFPTGPGLSKDPKDWQVTLGEHHLKNEDLFEQIRQVEAIFIHPQFKEPENQVAGQEIKSIPPDYDVG